MKNLLLATLLLFSINGFAFNWEKVGTTSNYDLYVDIDNITKNNKFIYFWELTDHFTAQEDGSFSDIVKYKADCAEGKKTLLAMTAYSQPMGKGSKLGDVIKTINLYPKPKTAGYVTMKFACNYAK